MVYKVNFVTTFSLCTIERKLEHLSKSFNIVPVEVQYDITGMVYSKGSIKNVVLYIIEECDKVETTYNKIRQIREIFESNENEEEN